jgi:hypothetical protein
LGFQWIFWIEETIGGKDMEMGVKDGVVAKGMDRGGSGDSVNELAWFNRFLDIGVHETPLQAQASPCGKRYPRSSSTAISDGLFPALS